MAEPEMVSSSVEPTAECSDCLDEGGYAENRPDNFMSWLFGCAVGGIVMVIAVLVICTLCKVHAITRRRKSAASQAKWCRSSDLKMSVSDGVANGDDQKGCRDNRMYCDHPSRILFNEHEANVLSEMEVHSYRTRYVLMMCLPSLLSIVFLPLSIVLYKPIVDLLWPPEQFDKPPVINEVISSFLVPAGLVYATSFGYSLQEAFAIQQSFREWVTNYNMSMKQIIISLGHLRNAGLKTNLKLIHLMKRSFVKCCCVVTKWDKNPDEYDVTCAESLFEVMSILHNDVYRVESRSDLQHSSSALHNRLVEMVLALQKHVGIMDIGHREMTAFEWVFLESVGYFSYFGILLLQADSYLFEMVMCFTTVLTISLFSYILSDLHYPCHGFFRIKLDPLFGVADLLQITFSNVKQQGGVALSDDSVDGESETDIQLALENYV